LKNAAFGKRCSVKIDSKDSIVTPFKALMKKQLETIRASALTYPCLERRGNS